MKLSSAVDDIAMVVCALSSCAIEGNEFAIELLELKDKNYNEFIEELIDLGLIPALSKRLEALAKDDEADN